MTKINAKVERRAFSDAMMKLLRFQKEIWTDRDRYSKALARLSEYEQQLIQKYAEIASRSAAERRQFWEPPIEAAPIAIIEPKDRSTAIARTILDAVRARGVTVVSSGRDTYCEVAGERLDFRLWARQKKHPTEYGRIRTGVYECTVKKHFQAGHHAPKDRSWVGTNLEAKAEAIADAVVTMAPLLTVARKQFEIETRRFKERMQVADHQIERQRRDDACWKFATQLAAKQHELDDLARIVQLLEANNAAETQPLLIWLKRRIAAESPLSAQSVAKLVGLQAAIDAQSGSGSH